MKNKNPLYVVKGKEVQEAKNLFDLVVKKLSLEPALHVLQNIFRFLLEQVKSFHTFIAVREFIDEMIVKYFALIKQFGLA
jgi:hypothetical protein